MKKMCFFIYLVHIGTSVAGEYYYFLSDGSLVKITTSGNAPVNLSDPLIELLLIPVQSQLHYYQNMGENLFTYLIDQLSEEVSNEGAETILCHNNPDTDENPVTAGLSSVPAVANVECYFCSDVAPDSRRRTRHCRREHKEEIEYYSSNLGCTMCSYCAPNISELFRHWSWRHKGHKIPIRVRSE